MYDTALFLHLLGAFAFVAGTIVAGVAFETARRRQTPAEIALLLGLSRIGVVLIGIGVLLAGVFGLWLVQLGEWGYGAGWVDAASALLVVTLLAGGIGGQRPKRARRLAVTLAAQDAPVSPQLRALLDDPVTRAVNTLSAAMLVAIIVLMVFKPGAPHS